MLDKLVADNTPKVRRRKAFVLDANIFAILKGGDDGRVCGWAPYAQLFQALDQAGFGIARRRLGEFLILDDFFQVQNLAVFQRRQFQVLFLPAFGHGCQKTWKDKMLASRLPLAGAAAYYAGRVVKDRASHLRSHKTAPDEAVKIVLLRREVLLYLIGRQGNVNWPDGLVRVLRAPFGLVNPGLGRQIVLAEILFHKFGSRVPGLVGNPGGISAHIGNQGGQAAIPQFQTFVKLLGYLHGPPGSIGMALVCGLLQGGSDKWRRGRPVAFLFLHAFNCKGQALDARFEVFSVLRIMDFGLLAVNSPELGLEFGRNASGKQGMEGPIFLGHKGLAFKFPLHNQPEGHRLDAACRNAALYGFPEQGGNFVAYKAVKYAPGLLGLEQVFVQFARMGEGILYGALGDLVELDTLDIPGLIVDELCHMPGNGLSLAVRVGRKIDRGRAGGLTTLRLFSLTSSCGAKFWASSTPRELEGKSRTWPTLALTSKSLPRNLLMVFTLAGDSTIISCLPII